MTKIATRLAVLLTVAGCVSNSPPSAPALSGPVFVGPDTIPNTGDTLQFRVVSRDPEYNSITYMIEWDDGTPLQWSAFFQPGDTVSRAHVYADTGTYYLQARARDVERAQSGWSDSLRVRIR